VDYRSSRFFQEEISVISLRPRHRDSRPAGLSAYPNLGPLRHDHTVNFGCDAPQRRHDLTRAPIRQTQHRPVLQQLDHRANRVGLHRAGTVTAIFSGQGKQPEPDSEALSTIIEALNERFGTNLNDRDQLLFDQFEETWVADPEVAAQARNNEFENFRLVFDRMFMGTVVGRMDDNEEIYKRVLDDAEFQKTLMDLYAMRIYRRLRE
jgi:hypothetical protein